jgi:tryptophanyl-tRNA synthetase
MKSKKMITAVSPSGDMTYDLKVFIANLHAITIPQEPEQLHERIKKMAALYFACGLNPEKATVFLQSEVNEHAMLG